jgi:phage/conjugal plasmid C-4 type zinc finger TraR family protein
MLHRYKTGSSPMAGGWARDGAVNDQIDASIEDELKRMQARRLPVGDSLTRCAECDEPIPEARRQALQGVKLCVDCQNERDGRQVKRGGINRRGSKDSQLK